MSRRIWAASPHCCDMHRSIWEGHPRLAPLAPNRCAARAWVHPPATRRRHPGKPVRRAERHIRIARTFRHMGVDPPIRHFPVRCQTTQIEREIASNPLIPLPADRLLPPHLGNFQLHVLTASVSSRPCARGGYVAEAAAEPRPPPLSKPATRG